MSVEEYNAARGVASQDFNDTNVLPEIDAIDIKVDFVDICERARWGETSTITLTPSRHQARSTSTGKYENHILVLRRKFDEDGEKSSTELEVRSLQIQKAFQVVLGDYPSLNFHSSLVAIPKPYAPLFHYRKELRDYASDSSRTLEETQHLSVLTKFMDNHLSYAEREYGYIEPYHMVSYPLLWTLFRPEEIIIAQGDHFEECFMVDSFDYFDKHQSRGEEDAIPFFKIYAKRWDFNGTRFGMSEASFKIKEFPTKVKIDTLIVYPIRFHKKEDIKSLQKRLVDRGERWAKMLNKTHMRYNCKASFCSIVLY